MGRVLVRAALVAGLLLITGAGLPAAEDDPPWLANLKRWSRAVAAHVPGQADEAVQEQASWSADDVRGVVHDFLTVRAAIVKALKAAPQSVFRSGVEAVRLDVLVSDGRKAVSGLRAADFEVKDNGVPQRVELIGFDEVPLNVVIALDESSSLTGRRLEQLRAGGAQLAGILKQNDRAAMLTFNETVTLRAEPTTALDRIRGAIAEAQVADGTRPTALVDAVFASVLTAEREAGRSLVVVFSDGVDTGSWLRGEAVLEIAGRSDVVVYAVATYHAGRGAFLGDLIKATGGGLFEVDEGGDIGAAFLAVLNEFRQRYLISYIPAGVTRDGWHPVSVRVKGRDLKVTARPGYWAGR